MPLIPLMLKDCELPMELLMVQWVDFQSSYDKGLRNTVAALSRLDRNDAADSAPAAVPQVINLRDLYARGLEAERQGDLEQAATFYGQIHDKEPGYLNGIVASKLTTLNERLYPERSRRLWEDAKRYRHVGEYSREVDALQALIGLGPKDAQAEERLPIATQNRDNADLYKVAQELVSLGDTDAAREQLALLWRKEYAPYYEDPAGVARKLDMKVPMTFEEVNERQQIDAARVRNEMAATSERDSRIKRAQSHAASENRQENANWHSAHGLVQCYTDKPPAHDMKNELLGWGAIPDKLLDSLDNHWSQRNTLTHQMSEAEYKVDRLEGFIAAVSDIGDLSDIGWLPVLWVIGAAFLFYHYHILIQGCGMVCGVVILIPLVPSLLIGRYKWQNHNVRKLLAMQQEVIEDLVSDWITHAERAHADRVSNIERDAQQLIVEAQTWYQQRMREITVEHDYEMAEIASKYQSALVSN